VSLFITLTILTLLGSTPAAFAIAPTIEALPVAFVTALKGRFEKESVIDTSGTGIVEEEGVTPMLEDEEDEIVGLLVIELVGLFENEVFGLVVTEIVGLFEGEIVGVFDVEIVGEFETALAVEEDVLEAVPVAVEDAEEDEVDEEVEEEVADEVPVAIADLVG